MLICPPMEGVNEDGRKVKIKMENLFQFLVEVTRPSVECDLCYNRSARTLEMHACMEMRQRFPLFRWNHLATREKRPQVELIFLKYRFSD